MASKSHQVMNRRSSLSHMVKREPASHVRIGRESLPINWMTREGEFLRKHGPKGVPRSRIRADRGSSLESTQLGSQGEHAMKEISEPMDHRFRVEMAKRHCPLS